MVRVFNCCLIGKWFNLECKISPDEFYVAEFAIAGGSLFCRGRQDIRIHEVMLAFDMVA